MKLIRKIVAAVLSAAILLTSVAAFDAPAEGSGLYGKSMVILGDSVCASCMLDYVEQGWPCILAQEYNLQLENVSASGSTMSDGYGASKPMVLRMMEIQMENPDYILIEGGINDFRHNVELGYVDQRDYETYMGALNTILDFMQDSYPDATIVCITPWITDGTENDLGLTTADYTDAMLQVCANRGILCYDASNADENGVHMDDPVFREMYCVSVDDTYHLNANGQKMYEKAISTWLATHLVYGEDFLTYLSQQPDAAHPYI